MTFDLKSIFALKTILNLLCCNPVINNSLAPEELV